MYQGNSASRTVALGGVLAALALCVMWLGGLLGIATYVSPMLCAILLQKSFSFGVRFLFSIIPPNLLF